MNNMPKAYLYISEENLQDINYFDALSDFFNGELKQLKSLQKEQEENSFVLFKINYYRLKQDNLYEIDIDENYEVLGFHRVTNSNFALRQKLKDLDDD